MSLCGGVMDRDLQARHKKKADLIWDIANLLRDDWKRYDFGKTILPLTVMRRFDCALLPTKDAVLAEYEKVKGKPEGLQRVKLSGASKLPFYNTSKFRSFKDLLGDPEHIHKNVLNYIDGFSGYAREAIKKFNVEAQIDKLEEKGLLYAVIKEFASVDLDPRKVTDIEMGYIYEELNRKFAEISNEEAGQHFTPREVICLMAHLLFATEDEYLSEPHKSRDIYDPAAGTGGMLSVAHDYIKDHNKSAELHTFGQELEDEAYAIALSNLLIRGYTPDNIKQGNTLTNDLFPEKRFHYQLANPPFGTKWGKKYGKKILEEYGKGPDPALNRYHAGLPSKTDAQLLFLQHMTSKMKAPGDGGGRFAMVSNGSPLFTGDATSKNENETAIRRWLFESDLVEAIVALPDSLFYNTGINVYVWIITNRKSPERRGKVQLIDARKRFDKMKGMGFKRKEIGDEHILDIVKEYSAFKESKTCQIHPNEFFGYRKIIIQRALRCNWAIEEERFPEIRAQSAFKKLAESDLGNDSLRLDAIEEGKALQATILDALRANQDGKTHDQGEFRRTIKQVLDGAGIKVSQGVVNAVVNGLRVRDENAPIQTKITKGGVVTVADSTMKDEERVPLTESNEEYFEREVKPYVQDAWIDDSVVDCVALADDGRPVVGRIGYEVNFTRYFYVFTKPRPLTAIDKDILTVEDRIAKLLRGREH